MPFFERVIQLAHGFPVVAQIVERRLIEPGVALRVLQRRDDAVQVRLAGHAAHRRDRRVDDVDARVGGAQDAAGVDAAGVVRVEMDRHADFLAQRLHQRVRRVRLAQPGHVLDGQDVRAHLAPAPWPCCT